jgi:hypothetical protein
MEGKVIPGIQRMQSSKRAILIPQKTNLKLELNEANLNNNIAVANVVVRTSRSRRPSLEKPIHKTESHDKAILSKQSSFAINLKEELGLPLEANISFFLEESPAIGLTKEDSKIVRTRVLEEMIRIQQRSRITPEEREKLYQIAITMDAPMLAKQLVTDAKEAVEANEHSAFLTGAYRLNFSSSSSSSSSDLTHDVQKLDRILFTTAATTTSAGINVAEDDDEIDDNQTEENLYSKAVDEVERIRQRMIIRAANISPPPSKQQQISQSNLLNKPSQQQSRPGSKLNHLTPSDTTNISSSQQASAFPSPRILASPRIPSSHPMNNNHISNHPNPPTTSPPLTTNISNGINNQQPKSLQTSSNNIRQQQAWSKVFPTVIETPSTPPIITTATTTHSAITSIGLKPNTPMKTMKTPEQQQQSHHQQLVSRKPPLTKQDSLESLPDDQEEEEEVVAVGAMIDSILGSHSSCNSQPLSRGLSDQKSSYNRLFIENDHDLSNFSFPDSFLRSRTSPNNHSHQHSNNHSQTSSHNHSFIHSPKGQPVVPFDIAFDVRGEESVPLTDRSDLMISSVVESIDNGDSTHGQNSTRSSFTMTGTAGNQR